MKSLCKILSVFVVYFFFLSAVNADTYKIDPNHSMVEWHVSHFGFSSPSGKWFVEGTLTLDEAQPETSKVNVTIKLADLVTGLPKFDKHLKSSDFFDIAKYPTATFVSDKVDVTGKDTAKVHGTLTLHGVSKPVTLDVVLNKSDKHPMSEKKAVGFTAKTMLKRSDFGINKYLPGVGDDVKIDIELEASKAD